MAEVLDELPGGSAPAYVTEKREPEQPREGNETARWVKGRLAGFPVPTLSI